MTTNRSDGLPCQSGNPDRYFPGFATGQQIAAVKAECRPCPLRESCLDWALRHGESGIWGGTTEPERKQLRHQRHIAVESIHVTIRDDRADAVRDMVARGMTGLQIAAAMHLSPSGAANAIARVKRRGRAS